jgi:GNAT superfamily N-acetyltransferase
MRIRTAHAADLPVLQNIETEAGLAFRDVGMDEVADDDEPAIDTLAAYVEAGHAWVACDGEAVAAYIVVEPVDDCLHIEQVSVRPAYARQAIGRSLIEHVASVAADAGYPALTLTTFRDVPWNAPYYTRLGFAVLDAPGPDLSAIRAAEATHGLDRWPRISMRRELV